MLKTLTVIGTRPEVIKMAPVIGQLEMRDQEVLNRTCLTGQHQDMVGPLLDLFGIRVDFNLDLMRPNQTLEYVTTGVLEKVGRILREQSYDFLLVQGDTTTCMAASLAAFYAGVRVGHVEAGLRTYDKRHPYPEEVNRKIIDALSDLYFAHTERAKANLLAEGVRSQDIEVTGNTVIDALLDVAVRDYAFEGTELDSLVSETRRVVLVTAHRRENFGAPLEAICRGLRQLAERYRDSVVLVYPVHPNPNVHSVVMSMLGEVENILLTPPLDYLALVHLLKQSSLVLTDSGGLQEEAPSMGKPVLVLRKMTERPEGVEAGTVRVIGTEASRIVEETSRLLDNEEEYCRMASRKNPYGDGTASVKIVQRLLRSS